MKSPIILNRPIYRIVIILVVIIELYFHIRSVDTITIRQQQKVVQVDEVIVQEEIQQPPLLSNNKSNVVDNTNNSRQVSFSSLVSSLPASPNDTIAITISSVNEISTNIITLESNTTTSTIITNQTIISNTSNTNSSNNHVVNQAATITATTNTSTSLKSSTGTNNKTTRTRTIPRDHPHAGAVDINGNYGYVANVTKLRLWMIQQYCTNHTPPSSSSSTTTTTATTTTTSVQRSCRLPFATTQEENNVCNIPPTRGVEGRDGGWDIVANIVQVPTNDDLLFDAATATTTIRPPKVLCAVYTYHKKHTRIRGIAETWGWRCDGFFAASDRTISTFNETKANDSTTTKNHYYYAEPPVEVIQILHEGNETYHNMWQKTRSILSYMYDNYIKQYDYFYVVGDDTHLIVENLKLYLMKYEKNHYRRQPKNNTNNNHTEPIMMFTGQVMKLKRGMFISGGGGYVLSRRALQQFVEIAIPVCYPHAMVSAEDRFVSNCMKQYLNLPWTDSTDPVGKQRFHSFSPDAIARNVIYYAFYATYNYFIKLRGGQNFTNTTDMVSTTSISFHRFKSIVDMKRHHAILYRSCSNTTKLGTALLSLAEHRI